MSKQNTGARLNQGNHIYLYRLLRDALGCGKQTFMTQVEEALVAGDMAAADLGFESTRELLEELDDCIKLTVFKGGRIYATVIANEQWDAALAKGDAPKQKDTGKKQKSWKKKKGDKALKAVRPKHVKRPEPEPQPEPAPQPKAETEPSAETTAETEIEAESTDEFVTETAETVELINSEIFSAEDEPAEEPTLDMAEEAAESEPVAVPEAPQPKISLTVVYDPEHANAGMRKIESTPLDEASQTPSAAEASAKAVEPAAAEQPVPVAEPLPETEPVTPSESKAEPKSQAEAAETDKTPDTKPKKQPEPKSESVPKPKSEPETEKKAPADHESKPTPKAPAAHKPGPKATPASRPNHALKHEGAQKPKPTPAPASAASPASVATPASELPKIPDDYPVDFALEVFCPGPLLHELSTFLPYGADALGIAGEYYWIARERGTIQASRNRATFPLRYTRDGKRHEVTIRIRRNTSGPGATWAIDKVETSANPSA